MSKASWVAALRIARRDALQHKGRSALVIAMIALPVLGVTMADVLARSAHLTPQEQLNRHLGAATARLTIADCAPVMQNPSGDQTASRCGPSTSPTTNLQSLLPAGSDVVSARNGGIKVRDSGGGVVATEGEEFNYASPVVAGMIRQVTGRAPKKASEVVLSSSMAHLLGLSVGDTLQTVDPDTSFTIVGTVQKTASRHDGFVIGLPGSGLAGVRDTEQGTDFFVHTPSPVTWNDVLALNAHGVIAESRAVVLAPPPDSAVPIYQKFGRDSFLGDVDARIALVVVAGMALLEVVLLAGPAFAVGARRMRRQLALVAASGGARHHVRNIVLASGVVLGLAGGLLGAAAGLGLALIARPLITTHTGTPFGGLHLHVGEIAGIAGLGLLTGLLAAMFPAHAASRQDVVAALAGRRGALRTPRRMPTLGVMMFGAGAAVAVYGAATAQRANFILAGAIIAELGLVACTATLVGWAGRLGALLPAAPRMALRDAARNRSRTAPAVSAIMAAVAGTVAIGIYLASDEATQRANYTPLTRIGQASVPLSGPNAAKYAAPIAEALQQTLPTRNVVILQASGRPCEFAPGSTNACEQVNLAVPPGNMCPLGTLNHRPTPADLDAAKHDWRCQSPPHIFMIAGNVFVGDAKTLAAVAGLNAVDQAKASEMLARGGLVTFDRPFVAANGTATIESSVITNSDKGGPPTEVHRETLPALYLRADVSIGQGFVSAATAVAAHLSPAPVGVLADTTRMPTSSEQKAARRAVALVGSTEPVHVERGFQGHRGVFALILIAAAGVITLGASGIVTGLTAADSRADHATLAAIGANPRTRRLLAMSSSGVTAFLGSLLGVLAGFIPALGVLHAQSSGIAMAGGPSSAVSIPWPQLVVVVIALPALAALFAGLFTRSRLPMPRRAL